MKKTHTDYKKIVETIKRLDELLIMDYIETCYNKTKDKNFKTNLKNEINKTTIKLREDEGKKIVINSYSEYKNLQIVLRWINHK